MSILNKFLLFFLCVIACSATESPANEIVTVVQQVQTICQNRAES